MGKKTKKSNRPPIEILIILVFFACVIAWSFSKCSTKKLNFAAEDAEMEPISMLAENISNDTIATPTVEITQLAKSENNLIPVIQTKVVSQTKLYVTIEGMKLRKRPSVNSSILKVMPLYDELTFLNEVTDSTEIISLGNEIFGNDPWVKVRHWEGSEGWVYGAGVHYYKVKFPGLD